MGEMGTTIAVIETGASLASLAAIARFSYRLQRSIATAPRLELPSVSALPPPPSVLTVIIPAYNEELNLQDCVQAVLASDLPRSLALELWIADDESTDQTAQIASALASADPRIHVLTVPPRPTQETWRGKNWACAQAAEQATGDYLLFIDADVRLEPGAIAAALADAQQHQTDLLSCAPEIVCGCFAEWLVQPLIMALLAVGFQFDALNDPANPTAFAAGPFMLFRRQAYAAIGGHRAVAAEVVEDVELARRIKGSGLRLRYILGLGLVKVRMYRSFAALWEGWTKNLYLGAQRSLKAMLLIVIAMTLLYILPWLTLATILTVPLLHSPSPITDYQLPITNYQLPITHYPLPITHYPLPITHYPLPITLITLAAQYWLRKRSANLFTQPLRYWWLSWLGGGLVATIAIVSIIKTETGWGWTWRGRSLKPNTEQPTVD